MQFDAWLTTNALDVLDAPSRAALAWRRISDRPSSVALIRAGAKLTAQTMRLEADNTARKFNGGLEVIGRQYVTLFGIRDHATLSDTDIERSDRVMIDGTSYEVIALVTPPGEVQALCEATRAT